MVTVETASTSSETTKKNKNKACQGNHVSKTPEIIGPTAKAEPMTNPAVPITRPRSLCGVIVSNTVWKLGKIIPTAIASSNRPIMSTVKLGAQIHKPVPMAKMSSIAWKSRWKGTLCNSHGLTGIIKVITNIKPVVSQATVSAPKPKAFIKAG